MQYFRNYGRWPAEIGIQARIKRSKQQVGFYKADKKERTKGDCYVETAKLLKKHIPLLILAYQCHISKTKTATCNGRLVKGVLKDETIRFAPSDRLNRYVLNMAVCK